MTLKLVPIVGAIVAVVFVTLTAMAKPDDPATKDDDPWSTAPRADAGAPRNGAAPPAVAPAKATTPAVDGGAPDPGAAAGAGAAATGVADEADKKKWFVPWVEMYLDTRAFAGRGISEYRRVDGFGLYPGTVLALTRLGVRGSLLDKFGYSLLLEMGAANNRGPLQTSVFTGGFNDAWVEYRAFKPLNFRLGQFPPPFGLEQMRTGAYWDFSRQSRTNLLTNNGGRDMGGSVYGFVGPLAYTVGLFNGESRSVAPVDDQFNTVARVAVRINEDSPYRLAIGTSASLGGNDPKTSISQPLLAGLSTTGGYTFWDNTYLLNTPGAAPAEIRILRAGPERQIGGDFILQLGDLDLNGEGAYVQYGRREVGRNTLESVQTLRAGEFSGVSYYVGSNVWLTRGSLLRDARFFWGRYEGSRIKYPERDSFKPAIAVRARWEQQILIYDSIARSPEGTIRGLMDYYTRNLVANSIHMAALAWFSTRVLVLAEYGLYWFPAHTITDPGAAQRRLDNQALAPGAVVQGERGTTAPPNLPQNVGFGDVLFYRPYDLGARSLHEFTLRVGVQIP
jgi:hypothetical protein